VTLAVNFDPSQVLGFLQGTPVHCGQTLNQMATTIQPVAIVSTPNGAATGSTFFGGEHAAAAAAFRIYQWVPQRVLGSILCDHLSIGNFAGAAIGVRIEFVVCPAFLQLALPGGSYEQGSCDPMGTSNAFFTTDSTAVGPIATDVVPAGGTLQLPLYGFVLDPGRMLQVTADAFPSDLSARLAWRNFGAKQQGPTFVSSYRAP
jgi:hypothetical protein